MILPLILEWINFLKFCTTYWMFNKIELEKMNTIIEVVLKQETSPQFSKFLCYLLYRFNIGSGRLFQGPFTQELFTCNLGSLILGFDKLCYKVWASANSRPCWKWDRHVESLRSEFVGPKPMGFQALFSFCPELGFCPQNPTFAFSFVHFVSQYGRVKTLSQYLLFMVNICAIDSCLTSTFHFHLSMEIHPLRHVALL